MRILIHDFGGYPFPPELSRALARRGHTVLHAYCGSLQTTPQGNLQPHPDDPPALEIKPVRLPQPLNKFSLFTRWRQERTYGHLIAAEADRFCPDVVLSGNTPLDAQARLLKHCRTRQIPFAFWLQDLIGLAAHSILKRKVPLLGAAVGRYYLQMERRLLRQSDAVVPLTEDFRPLLQAWGVDAPRIHVIENWAPLDAYPVRPKTNAWATEHDLADKRCLIYTGTMGMKHDPALLLRLATHFQAQADVRIVVVSQGLGADWLAAQKARHGLDNLILHGFVPFEQVPDVMGAADVLVAVLEADAGVFSVPSKVLSYLCAARPLLMAVPPENLAARIVVAQEAGFIAPPDDLSAFIRAAETLLGDPDLRAAFGRNARAYAERTFDIETIATAFEQVLAGTRAGAPQHALS
jgi:colanic acid biosynthesis glycosyl transferase WcaI